MIKCQKCQKEFEPVEKYHKLGAVAFCPFCNKKHIKIRVFHDSTNGTYRKPPELKK